MSTYKIISTGNTILAAQPFMDAVHPNDYTLIPDVPVVIIDLCQFLIDIGPFMDRFGSSKLAVLVSTDATVKAIVQDMMARKWIDLKRSDVTSGLAYIGSVVASVTPTLQATILTTTVTHDENLALRKLYFS